MAKLPEDVTEAEMFMLATLQTFAEYPVSKAKAFSCRCVYGHMGHSAREKGPLGEKFQNHFCENQFSSSQVTVKMINMT